MNKQKQLLIKKYIFLMTILIFCLIFSLKYLTIAFNFYNTATPRAIDNHFTLLAQSLIKGRLDLQPGSYRFPNADLALYKGKYYVYFGPLPAILAIPGVLMKGDRYPSSLVSLFSSIICFLLVYKIAKKFRFQKTDSWWLAIFFVFGTLVASVALIFFSAYQTQIIGLLFILLSINEYLNNKRYFLMGFYISMAMATRINLFLTLIFFILTLIQDKKSINQKLINLVKLLTPIVLILIILFLYNFVRFGNFLETGFRYNTAISLSTDFQAALRYGLFSFHHIPTNLYYLFFKGFDIFVEPNTNIATFPYLGHDGWGLSIIFTSPLFILPFFLPGLKKSFNEILTIVIIAIPIMTYYGIGYIQYGYRYAMDFYPFLLLILLKSFNGKLLFSHKILIVYSVFINLFYMYSYWGGYPFINL
ncbi:MAG: hypothetical protein V1858_02370 [Candidatus Gottesmanbacteria bacterium]